jgi:hypothetical protein
MTGSPRVWWVFLIVALLVSGVVAQWPAAPAQAAIPKQLNFQGKMTNKVAGTNVTDGAYAMEFKLYTASSGGAAVWTETYDQASGDCAKVQLTSGIFSVKLGSCNSLANVDFSGGSMYLTVNFAPSGTAYDGEMSPRKQILASAFAFVANSLIGDGKIDITNTTSPQASLAYDGTNKLTVGVANNGFTTLTVAGSAAGFNLTGGNVGIGETEPTEKLTLADGANLLQNAGMTITPYGGLGRYENYIKYSEQFQQATAWTATNVTVTADSTAGPDSATTADTLATSASGGSVAQSTTTAVGSTYTFSVWLKTTSGTQSAALRIDGTTGGTGTAKVTNVTTGWRRFTVTQDTSSFTGNVRVSVFPGGTGGSGTVVAWGAQLEKQSSAGVYTKTIGSALAYSNNRGLVVDSTLTNSTSSGFLFGSRFNVTIDGSTAGTHDGVFIRTQDDTSLANTVRGLEVQAWSGTNTSGVNTGVAAFGKTFGLQGTTDALAGAVSQPAAIFADLDNGSAPGVGNAIRAYTDNATSATLVSVYQESSAFTGTGLMMDLGYAGSGSGSFNSGNFISLRKAGTERFKVRHDGSTFVSFINTGTAAVCHATNGTTVNDELVDCSGSVSADYAEMYPVDSDVEEGDVVMTGAEMVNTYDQKDGVVDWGTVKGQITRLKRANKSYARNLLGVVSDNYSDFSSTGYNIKEEDNPKSVALAGRVLVKVTTENGSIQPGDYLTASGTRRGYAMKATKAGQVIGQALAAYTSEEPGKVMVFVNTAYFNGVGIEEQLPQLNPSSVTLSQDILNYLILNNDAAVTSETISDRLIAGLELITPKITTQSLSVETISSSGGLTIAAQTMFQGGLIVDGISALGQAITLNSDTIFIGRPYFNNDTAGFAEIKAGARFVEIVFDREYLAQPIVNVNITLANSDTLRSEADPQKIEELKAREAELIEQLFNSGVQYLVTRKSEKGFTIMLNRPVQQNIVFSWVALAVKDAKIFTSKDSEPQPPQEKGQVLGEKVVSEKPDDDNYVDESPEPKPKKPQREEIEQAPPEPAPDNESNASE